MVSSGGVSLYKFVTSNSKSVMVVKTDFSTQSHCAVRFRGELPFRFAVGNTGGTACAGCCDAVVPGLAAFVTRGWRRLASAVARCSILLSRRLSRLSHLSVV